MYENNGVSGLIPSVFHKLDKSPAWFGELVPLVTVEEWEAEEYARWLDVVEGEQE